MPRIEHWEGGPPLEGLLTGVLSREKEHINTFMSRKLVQDFIAAAFEHDPESYIVITQE